MYPNGQRMKQRVAENQLKPLRISQVIDSCHRNQSIYEVIFIILLP